jgi:hypothetical protein
MERFGSYDSLASISDEPTAGSCVLLDKEVSRRDGRGFGFETLLVMVVDF